MKIYTIGRGETNSIHIDNEYVSRQHALLKVYPSGKMEIVDKSTNGTAINGRKLKPNIPYRVRRKDVVTFAGQSHLEWKNVPDPLKNYKIAVLCVLIVAILAIGFLMLGHLFEHGRNDIDNLNGGMPSSEIQVEPSDTAKNVKNPAVDVDAELKKMAAAEQARREAAARKKETEKKNRAEDIGKERQDSLKKAVELSDTTVTGVNPGL